MKDMNLAFYLMLMWIFLFFHGINLDKIKAIQKLQVEEYRSISHVDTTRFFVALKTDCSFSEHIRYTFKVKDISGTPSILDVCVGFWGEPTIRTNQKVLFP